uniref:ZPR1 jelly-roll domain-containing protein n=1 Tax=Glossina palpalis gambiensis TaxID=67801 RepID=A0A1B0APA0_9MUSC
MKDQLENDDLMFHDSLNEITKERLQKFLKKFNDVISLESEVSLILDDPAGNSFVQSSLDIDEPGDKWKIVKYESSYDQNEELD